MKKGHYAFYRLSVSIVMFSSNIMMEKFMDCVEQHSIVMKTLYGVRFFLNLSINILSLTIKKSIVLPWGHVLGIMLWAECLLAIHSIKLPMAVSRGHFFAVISIHISKPQTDIYMARILALVHD